MTFSLKPYRVLVIGGGWTGERDSNSLSAKNVMKHLTQNGVNAQYLEIDESQDLLSQLAGISADFAFLTVTEEVPIQPFLDAMGIPYNGSSNATTTLSLNKKYVKTILHSIGVLTPKDIVVKDTKEIDGIDWHTFPCIVKPVSSGESCGLSLVKSKDSLKAAVIEALKFDSEALVEEYVDGQEITIPVIGTKILPGVKITSKSGVWDYERKDNLDVVLSAVQPDEIGVNKQIKNMIKKISSTILLKSFWRLDTIYKDNRLYFLEINTQPCLAGGQTGLIPTSIKGLNWNHYEFLSHIAEDMLSNYKRKWEHIIRIDN